MRITYLCLGLAILFSACQGNENQGESSKASNDRESSPQVSESKSIDALLAEGQNHYLSGKLQSAIHDFQRVIEIDSTNLAALMNLGNVYYDFKDNQKAVFYYGKVLEIDSNNVNIRCDMATCYSRLNMLDTAMFLVRKNIEYDYNHVQSHYNLSVFYKRMGDEENGEKELVIAQELSDKQG